jgi:hypothetical protein
VNADGVVENNRLSSLQRKAKTAGLFYLLTLWSEELQSLPVVGWS